MRARNFLLSTLIGSFLMLCGEARASVLFERIVDGVSFDDLKITLTEDIHFTLTTAGTSSSFIVVFKDVMPVNSAVLYGYLGAPVAATFNLTVNAQNGGLNFGGPPHPSILSISSADIYSSFSPTDASDFTYNIGDVFTVKARYTVIRNWFSDADHVLPSTANRAQLLGLHYSIASDVMTIPEPSGLGLFVLGGAGLFLLRRRTRALRKAGVATFR